MPGEVSRWARRRAPELMARAEEEAVEELKRALLEAALAAEREAARARREPARREAAGVPREPAGVPREPAGVPREPASRTAAPQRPAQATAARPSEPSSGSAVPAAGDALWAYCVTRGHEPPATEGVHGSRLEKIEHDGLVAFVSRVPLSEFGEDPLRRNLNDLEWLERVARQHEAVLERALEGGTIVPLRICTIFADETGVARMLAEQGTALGMALDALEGRQEWGVKLLVDRAALEAAARERTPDAIDDDDELEARSAGGAYMLRRRRERQVREAADRLAHDLAEDVHARLQDWATDAVVNPPQNPELSGHEGDMLLNAAYLVEVGKVERLHELVAELRDRHSTLGARLELTGPWPPYNFVPRAETALA